MTLQDSIRKSRSASAPWSGRRRCAAALLAALLLGACFDPPVEETVDLEISAHGGATIRVRVEIAPEEGERSNRAVADRLERLRRDLVQGTDEWTPRFAELAPREEEIRWRRVEGEITLYERSARVDSLAEIDRFFADTGVGVFHTVDDAAGVAELALYPGTAGRATRRQRRQVERALGEWSVAIAGYLDAAGDLWEYLDLYPDRAAPVFASLLDDLVPEAEAAALGPLTDEEEPLVEALGDAMLEASAVLLIDPGEPYSLDELSRRVYDPFPGAVTVRPPAPAVEHEGFEPSGDDAWAIRPLGLWPALERLEDRFLAPDPLLLWVRNTRSGAEVDVEALAARPRRIQPLVTAAELEAELASGLRPAAAYRLVWALY